MHRRQVLHRDIKPENLLLDEHMNPKLCDFGLSCRENEHQSNFLCGTFEYMAPESVYHLKVGKEGDIWGLGVLLYEMLHGKPPFEAESLEDLKSKLKSNAIFIRKDLSEGSKHLLK